MKFTRRRQVRPNYPLLTLLLSLLRASGKSFLTNTLRPSLARDLLFRRFCRLELCGDIPYATTLGHFRQQLVQYGLWETLLGEMNRQLEAQQIIMSEGRVNIIDVTPVEAAQSGPDKGVDGKPTKDERAGWHVGQKTARSPPANDYMARREHGSWRRIKSDILRAGVNGE
jgi:IS5 family transposase